MPKTTLPCQYRTGKTVSSGAHAIVKEAIHIKTRKYYACKIVVKDDLPGSAHLVGNEISILKRVRSENINIVRLHDYFQTAHSIYLCLDLCTGGTLWDRITTQGVYNETKVIGIVRTLFLAVKHIHEAGVVHRDLRPENLFFRTPAADAPIMIFDFQHSRIVEDTPNPETDVDLRNTPRYMAPEILLEKFHDKPVDVWALGSIAFFVTTGSTPFDGDEPEQVAQAVVTGNIPEEKWDTVSINAREFISLCLSIEPAQRPTVEEALAYTWLVPATPHFLLKSSRMSSTSRVSSMRDLRLPRFFNPRRKWRILGHAVKALVLLHTLVKRHRPSAQSDTEDSTDQGSFKTGTSSMS
ncbi:kinase-like domain-containing protein [Mycena alexandri]|uniref:Kinase-like domain-containing protein n=1 Tax=Mycena alexandri TaxID=1745969 RepID=A0AAD6SP57_9AGAR|nr:kinase-like domain-containing protein [Mycena alexandri]